MKELEFSEGFVANLWRVVAKKNDKPYGLGYVEWTGQSFQFYQSSDYYITSLQLREIADFIDEKNRRRPT